MDKNEKLSQNYPCYPFLSGALVDPEQTVCAGSTLIAIQLTKYYPSETNGIFGISSSQICIVSEYVMMFLSGYYGSTC